MTRRTDRLEQLAARWRDEAQASETAAEKREDAGIDSEYLHAVRDMSRQHAAELEAVLAGATDVESL